MWRPLPPLVFGIADGAELVEDLVGHAGHALHLGEVAERAGVEVDPPLVGLLGVLAAAVPRVELDRRHLDRPDHRAELGHAELVGRPVPAREVQPHGLDPVGRAGGQPLLVDLLARQPGREAVQHARPLEQGVDDAGTDAQVVLDQVELGRPALGEVDPVGVGHLHDTVVHLDLGERRRHAPTVVTGPWSRQARPTEAASIVPPWTSTSRPSCGSRPTPSGRFPRDRVAGRHPGGGPAPRGTG